MHRYLQYPKLLLTSPVVQRHSIQTTVTSWPFFQTASLDPLADQTRKLDDSKITPMMSIQRTFDGVGFMDFGNAYLTIANGFLSGGITDTVDTVTGLVGEYDPEEVWNYEIGFKMDGWERKLRLNTAIFYTDYTDRQLTTIRISPEGRIAGALINAKSSYIAGIEMEAVVLPTDNLQLTANVTFNHGEIEEYDDERIESSTGTRRSTGQAALLSRFRERRLLTPAMLIAPMKTFLVFPTASST